MQHAEKKMVVFWFLFLCPVNRESSQNGLPYVQLLYKEIHIVQHG